MSRRLVTTGVAAQEIGVSPATLTRWVAAGDVVPATTTRGGHYRWDLAALRAQLSPRDGRDDQDIEAENIGRVLHAAIREWQIVTGDEWAAPPWDDAPERMARNAVDAVRYALDSLALTEEQQRVLDDLGERSHEHWMQMMTSGGWRYGEAKDEQARTHPCLVPSGELPEFQRQKSRLLVAIVNALRNR